MVYAGGIGREFRRLHKLVGKSGVSLAALPQSFGETRPVFRRHAAVDHPRFDVRERLAVGKSQPTPQIALVVLASRDAAQGAAMMQKLSDQPIERRFARVSRDGRQGVAQGSRLR